MASTFDKYTSYGNVIQITFTADVYGFVLNFASGLIKSRDRTEPPVGSMVVLEVYKKFQDLWLIELLYPKLVSWNRWFWQRRIEGDLMVWGSDPNMPPDFADYNNKQAAQYESGLDNSPMWDNITFNNITHHLLTWDVGLSSLLIRECEALEIIAGLLGYQDDVVEISTRRIALIKAVNTTLWNSELGLFVNKIVNESFCYRISPTSFYPLLAGIPSTTQALEMLQHLYDPNEFCVNISACPFSMPSISRDDPAFKDNNYWRGRIWGPMNLLVYLGLSRYANITTFARENLTKQSAAILLKDWGTHHHVQENNNALTGEGCDVGNADPFYHWGALHGFINLMEGGIVNTPWT